MKRTGTLRLTMFMTSVAGLALLTLTATSGLLSAEEVTVASTRAAAEGCILGAFSGRGEVVVETVEVPDLGDLAGRDLEIRSRLMRRPDLGQIVPVAVEFWRGETRVGHTAVTARVQVFRDVLVTTRKLARSAVVDPDAVTIERRDVRSLGDQVYASVGEVLGLRARRMVAEGRVLVAGDLERIPLVERGERVRAVVTIGGVTVWATAVALDDGACGDLIDVKNDRTGKRLRGVVEAQGVVRVEVKDVLASGG